MRSSPGARLEQMLGSFNPHQQPTTDLSFSTQTDEVNHDYDTYIAGGFAPLPIALNRARGSLCYDVDGNSYIDFLSMIAVNNMGHNHPRILEACIEALKAGATINLAFQNPWYGQLAKRATELFGYDKFVVLTSGGEAADAAMKIARKWGHLVKGIPMGQCHILSTGGCYHGVSQGTLSLFSKRSALFGPLAPNSGHISPSGIPIRFGNLNDVKKAFETDGPRIAAFFVEPIQGAAGVIVPPDGYLPGLAALCMQHNVLLVVDEIQTGLGRCGSLLYQSVHNVRADLVIVGKALSGGMYPMSGVLGDRHIMDLLDPVGSTMAANPPGCAAALAALDVLVDESLCERANEMGILLLSTLKSHNPPHVIRYEGAGLLWAIVMEVKEPAVSSRRLIALLAQRRVLANAIKGGRVRICPPLTIDRETLVKGAGIIAQALRDLDCVPEGLPGERVHLKYAKYVDEVQ